ncbi:hypothetical protein LJC56_03835 [Christensenellaceae bacterium OttesenSCG-928-K19]|nr:hypothetical protein [Christensenellaceae bacterium OttesenSCG-928-K19]
MTKEEKLMALCVHLCEMLKREDMPAGAARMLGKKCTEFENRDDNIISIGQVNPVSLYKLLRGVAGRIDRKMDKMPQYDQDTIPHVPRVDMLTKTAVYKYLHFYLLEYCDKMIAQDGELMRFLTVMECIIAKQIVEATPDYHFVD